MMWGALQLLAWSREVPDRARGSTQTKRWGLMGPSHGTPRSLGYIKMHAKAPETQQTAQPENQQLLPQAYTKSVYLE